MKVVKTSDVKNKDFAACNKKVIIASGKPCNDRDLPCGKNAR